MIRLTTYFLILPVLIGCGLSNQGDRDVSTADHLMEQRKFAEAIPLLEKSLNKPLVAYSKSDVLSMIGNCYNELEQFDQSLKFHQRAIKEDPKNHQAHVNKGIVHRLTGDYDAASECYATALKLAPDYAELHASAGVLAIFQEDYKKAIELLERSIELDDSLPVAHSNLAIAYATVGRFSEADQELKKAIIRGYHQPEIIRERINQLRQSTSSKK
jgi:tetratricopeptide (TPR) repeat protein